MRSIVRPICRSICQSITGKEFRKYLNFDGTIYAELTDAFAPAGDSEIEIEFATTETSGIINLLGSDTSTSSYIRIYFASANIQVNGVGGFVQVSSIGLNDGELHKVKFVEHSGGTDVYYDGVFKTTDTDKLLSSDNWNFVGRRGGDPDYFKGVISSVKFTDSVTPANNQELIFDSGSTQYELAEEGSIGSELVVNGGFDTNADNWTERNSPSSVAVSGGQVTITNTSYSGLYQTLSVDANATYMVDILTGAGATGVMQARIGIASAGTEYASTAVVDSTLYNYFIKPTTTSLTVTLHLNDADAGDTSVWDYVKAKKLTKAAILYNVDSSDWTEGVV